jgi:hypothetical protein
LHQIGAELTYSDGFHFAFLVYLYKTNVRNRDGKARQFYSKVNGEIRKALGVSVAGIVALLSKEFIKLMIFANLLTWPLATSWRKSGWITNESGQAIRAALANAVRAAELAV